MELMSAFHPLQTFPLRPCFLALGFHLQGMFEWTEGRLSSTHGTGANPRAACIITRPASTRRRWGGSCRPTRSDMTIRSICMLPCQQLPKPQRGAIQPMARSISLCAMLHLVPPNTFHPRLMVIKSFTDHLASQRRRQGIKLFPIGRARPRWGG